MPTVSEMVAAGKNSAEEGQEAFKNARVGGDGTQGASDRDKTLMTFNPDPHGGVWGNEESYQMAMARYTKFLGNHPVWGHRKVAAEYPIQVAKDIKYPTFTQTTWWPLEKTTLYQYCNCHEQKNSSRYRSMKLRRNHCSECGYWKQDNSDQYDWDPIVDIKKGKPELGGVIEAVHDVRGLHYDQRVS